MRGYWRQRDEGKEGQVDLGEVTGDRPLETGKRLWETGKRLKEKVMKVRRDR